MKLLFELVLVSLFWGGTLLCSFYQLVRFFGNNWENIVWHGKKVVKSNMTSWLFFFLIIILFLFASLLVRVMIRQIEKVWIQLGFVFENLGKGKKKTDSQTDRQT